MHACAASASLYTANMNIREWRESRGLTQENAAKLCDVPWRSWWRWENGRVQPSLEAADKIIKASEGAVTLSDMVKAAQS